jgi:HAD superfamily hydrolase (TIGR01484 family)
MKWRALATDFDGTIATDAVVDEPTQFALVRLRSANVRTLLVTGRHLSDFEAMASFITIFDIVVAENGAVLFEPELGLELQVIFNKGAVDGPALRNQ